MILACEIRVVSELNNVAQRFTVDAREVHYFMEQWSRTSMIHGAQVRSVPDGYLMPRHKRPLREDATDRFFEKEKKIGKYRSRQSEKRFAKNHG